MMFGAFLSWEGAVIFFQEGDCVCCLSCCPGWGRSWFIFSSRCVQEER